MNQNRIHPLDLVTQTTPDSCILDVRTAAEVNAASLPNCIHIPLHELTAERLKDEIKKQGKNADCVYLLCQSGRRSELAEEQLRGKMNSDLVIVEGGINALKSANIPLQESGRDVIPLERQVRIAAGILVIIGIVLGSLVHPGLYGLSAFVGAGLTISGITDVCPMGMVIAKMPWNNPKNLN
jgi:rhodanese-related sulfurtransferase